LGSTSNFDAHLTVYRQEKFTPITLNKNIQQVQAAKQFIENNVKTESLQYFSKVKKKPYYPQDDNEDQIREQQVCRSAVNLNAGKQCLKRKRVQFSEAKLSSRRTKSNRRVPAKSRFSREFFFFTISFQSFGRDTLIYPESCTQKNTSSFW
jgi:hypothetical protein